MLLLNINRKSGGGGGLSVLLDMTLTNPERSL